MHVGIEWRRPNSNKSHIRQRTIIENLEYQSFGNFLNPVNHYFFTCQIILGAAGLINGVGSNTPREETTMMQACFE